MTMSKMLE